MQAKLISRDGRCYRYGITDHGFPVMMVTVTNDGEKHALHFEFHCETHPSERKPVMLAILAIMP